MRCSFIPRAFFFPFIRRKYGKVNWVGSSQSTEKRSAWSTLSSDIGVQSLFGKICGNLQSFYSFVLFPFCLSTAAWKRDRACSVRLEQQCKQRTPSFILSVYTLYLRKYKPFLSSYSFVAWKREGLRLNNHKWISMNQKQSSSTFKKVHTCDLQRALCF